jgi:amidohydrolase
VNLSDSLHVSTERWKNELIRVRRALHEHPELAFEEHETARLVQAFMARLGLAQRTGIGGTGIVAMLEGGRPGPTIAVRADMDALPLSEPDDLPFASKIAGRMHACGHDAHMAIALGAAAVLGEQREHLSGRVMFIFQPAEETLSGARAML